MVRGFLAALVIPIIIVSVHCQCQCEPKPCEVRLRTDAGWACGRVRDAENGTKYASFRGVPYAKPPLGRLRFKELEPPDPWDNLLDATEDSAVCPQNDLIYSRIKRELKGQSEDCIYLNLHVPYNFYKMWVNTNRDSQNTTEKLNPGLPIMVFIHGGAYHSGSGLTDLHGPEYLMTKDVIIITFNFRINVFGFLTLNSTSIPGNQGLRDMVTLLRWVQRNARNFGGDPDNVTLMGHSSGATCAHLLSLSEASKGLIHKVILLSGTAIPNHFTAAPAYAKKVADMFLANLGINSTDPEYVHDQLTRLPLLNIMNALVLLQLKAGMTTFVPVIESEFPNITRIIDDEPIALIAKGRGNDLPLLNSFTSEEGEFFRVMLLNRDVLGHLENKPLSLLSVRMAFALPSNMSLELANKTVQKYMNGTPTIDKYLKAFGDLHFTYPAFKVAEWKAAMGRAPVYLCQYSYESEHSVIKEAQWSMYRGAAHVEDLTLIFRVNSMVGDHISFPPKTNDDRMKDWLTTLISNFMRCSNPTCTQDESNWPPMSRDKIQYQDILEPMVYQMSEPSEEHLDMIRFHDSIDSDCRNVTEMLRRRNGGNILRDEF